jgi:hypothetical protein
VQYVAAYPASVPAKGTVRLALTTRSLPSRKRKRAERQRRLLRLVPSSSLADAGRDARWHVEALAARHFSRAATRPVPSRNLDGDRCAVGFLPRAACRWAHGRGGARKAAARAMGGCFLRCEAAGNAIVREPAVAAARVRERAPAGEVPCAGVRCCWCLSSTCRASVEWCVRRGRPATGLGGSCIRSAGEHGPDAVRVGGPFGGLGGRGEEPDDGRECLQRETGAVALLWIGWVEVRGERLQRRDQLRLGRGGTLVVSTTSWTSCASCSWAPSTVTTKLGVGGVAPCGHRLRAQRRHVHDAASRAPGRGEKLCHRTTGRQPARPKHTEHTHERRHAWPPRSLPPGSASTMSAPTVTSTAPRRTARSTSTSSRSPTRSSCPTAR